MNKTLTIEYETFENIGAVMSIVDGDVAINMFRNEEAEELYNKLITVVE